MYLNALLFFFFKRTLEKNTSRNTYVL